MRRQVLWDLLDVLEDVLHVGVVLQIDAKSVDRVVELGDQEDVSKGDLVTDAVLATLGLLKSFIKGLESSLVAPLHPWNLVLIAKSLAHVLQDAQVLDRLRSSVHDLAKSAHLVFLDKIRREKLRTVRVRLLDVLKDG